MASTDLSPANFILPSALANAALLIAAPSLGSINTYITAITTLCKAYDFHVPDLEHVLKCRTMIESKLLQEINDEPNDIQIENGHNETCDQVQEVTCIYCNEAHSETNYVCPVKQELFEEYSTLYLSCRSEVHPSTQVNPLMEMSKVQPGISIQQDQAICNTLEGLQDPVLYSCQYTSKEALKTIAQIKVSPKQKQHPHQTLNNRNQTLSESEHAEFHSHQKLDSNCKSLFTEKEHQRNPDQSIINISSQSMNAQGRIVQSAYSNVDNSKSKSIDNRHQNHQPLNIFNGVNSKSNDKELQKDPVHDTIDNNKLQSNAENIFDKSYLKFNGKDIMISVDVNDDKRNVQLDNKGKGYQDHHVHNSLNGDVRLHSTHNHKSKYFNDISKSSDENDRLTLYSVLDNNGKSQSTYSKEKAKVLLTQSMSVTYCKRSACTVYVSTIINGSTRSPWLHLEFIMSGGHKGQKHIPFSRINKICITKKGITIRYTSPQKELPKTQFLYLQVPISGTCVGAKNCLTLLKWLHSFQN